MRVITFNCWLPPWGKDKAARLPFIAEALMKEAPDIIFLQEVFSKKHAAYIAAQLKEYGLNFFFHTQGLLLISRYPAVSCTARKFKHRNPFFSWSIFGRWFKNKYQVMIANVSNTSDVGGDSSIALVNIHTIGPNYNTPRTTRIREAQITEICEYAASLDATKIIMAGDFNSGMTTNGYKIITERFGFADFAANATASTFSKSNTHNAHGNPFVGRDAVNFSERIDHIFTRGFGGRGADGRIIFAEPRTINGKSCNISDHYGLMVEV